MSVGAVLRAMLVVFVAAMLQTVIVSSIVVGGGAPDLLLVVVVALGLVRGAIPGAVFGFTGGVVVDLVTLGAMGVTSLVLTLAGYWAGRYGETTGRDRRYAPVIAAGAITLLAAVFGYVLHYLLGEEIVAQHALVTTLLPALVLNVALALPLYAVVRRTVGEGERLQSSNVEVLAG
ncbi:MAG: rod shape-determining protein MreD [Gaiellaceae bacterium]